MIAEQGEQHGGKSGRNYGLEPSVLYRPTITGDLDFLLSARELKGCTLYSNMV